MKVILFVDDELNVLNGLRRMLRPMRREWEMHFAGNGAQALSLLAGIPFDVIMSDMRMPGMDGIQLLNKVKARYPQVVRILLSGQSDDETVLRSIGSAHQYLAKPCDGAALRSAVSRACLAHNSLDNESLKQLLSQISSLPSTSSHHRNLIQQMASPDCSIARVAAVVNKDLGMSARILQLANSSAFGVAGDLSNIEEAVSIIGLKIMKDLVSSIRVFPHGDRNAAKGFDLETLASHSVATGILAQEIARLGTKDEDIRDSAYTAGLLHDVGKLVFAVRFREEYDHILSAAAGKGAALRQAEQERFGAEHGPVGAYLMGIWGLPDSVVEAVAYHHQPRQCSRRDFSPLTAVHVADAMQYGLAGETDAPAPETDREYLGALGLLDRLNEWQAASRHTDPPLQSVQEHGNVHH